METYRRFLRFVIPGLIFLIELSLYLVLSSYTEFLALINIPEHNIAVPISVLLVSGGIGAFFAAVYHSLYLFPVIRWITIDHRPAIIDFEKIGWLELRRRDNDQRIEGKKLTQRVAWRIVSAFWYKKGISSKRIKGAYPRVNTLNDIMHGTGTTVVGSFSAVLAWIFIYSKLSNGYSSNYFFILPFLIFLLHLYHYRALVKDFRSIVEIIMMDELREMPTTIYLAEDDVKEGLIIRFWQYLNELL